MKLDGYRAQVAVAGSEVVVYTRNGHDWTRQFKVILSPLRALTKGSGLIDGEILAIDSKGRTNFSLLKTGIAAGMPLTFFAFDLLELDGHDLADLPLYARNEKLADLLGERDPGDSLQFSTHTADSGKVIFDAMCAGGTKASSPSARTAAMSETARPAGSRSNAPNGRNSWSAATARATAAMAWTR